MGYTDGQLIQSICDANSGCRHQEFRHICAGKVFAMAPSTDSNTDPSPRVLSVKELRDRLPGLPVNSIFAEQATRPGSELAAKLYTTLKDEDQAPPFEPEDLVQLSLLTEADRTAACNLLIFNLTNLPFYRKRFSDSEVGDIMAEETVRDASKAQTIFNRFRLLIKRRTGLWGGGLMPDGTVPPADPEGHTKWKRSMNANRDIEMGKPEGRAVLEPNQTEGSGSVLRRRPSRYRYCLPPGMENSTFGRYYQRASTKRPSCDLWYRLPKELKDLVLSFLVVFPYDLIVTARFWTGATARFSRRVRTNCYGF